MPSGCRQTVGRARRRSAAVAALLSGAGAGAAAGADDQIGDFTADLDGFSGALKPDPPAKRITVVLEGGANRIELGGIVATLADQPVPARADEARRQARAQTVAVADFRSGIDGPDGAVARDPDLGRAGKACPASAGGGGGAARRYSRHPDLRWRHIHRAADAFAAGAESWGGAADQTFHGEPKRSDIVPEKPHRARWFDAVTATVAPMR
jgi:hypothetical protein